jgi:hypothetical protein
MIGYSRRTDISLGSCCFSINLDLDFAKKTRDFKFDHQRKFEENVRELVGYKYVRTTFLDDTLFLRSFSVEGNCACMGVCGGILDRNWDNERVITYNGHNIDSKEQAYDIMTVFSYWVDTAEIFLMG